MAAKKWKIAALWGMHEVTYKTEPDADGSDYKFIKATEIAFQPQAEVIERPAFTNDLVRQEHVIGPKGGTLTFKIELKGSGTAAGNGTAAIAAESSPILESILGTVVRGTGKLTDAGSTTSAINIVVGGGASYTKGMAVSIAGEVRFVASIAGDVLTLDRPLTGAPGAGVIVYASSLFRRANTGHKSLAFVGKRDGIEYTFLGCKAAAKIEGVSARGTALLAVTVDVGTWSVTTKASLPSTELSGITAVKAPVVKGSPFALGGTEEVVSALDFDIGTKFEFQESTSDADNKAGIELVDSTPQGTVKAYYAASHLTDFQAGTVRSFTFAAGDQTNGWGLYVPKAQLGNPTLEDKTGMVGEALPFMPVDNGTDLEVFLSVF